MLSKIKKISKQTLVYGFGNILSKVVGFILIPIYTIHISIDSFGILAILEMSIMAISGLISLGVPSGYSRFFYKEKEAGTHGIFLFNNYIGVFFLAAIGCLILYLFSQDITLLLFTSVNYEDLIVLVIAIVFFESQELIPRKTLQLEDKPISYILLNASKLLISLAFTIYFIVYQELGIIGVLYGRLIGSTTIFTIGLFFIVIPRIKIKFKLSNLKHTISYGLPLVISGIGYLVYSMSDRFMLNWISTEAETGRYAFGYRIANLVHLVFIQSIGISYFPNMLQNENKKDNKRFYRKILTYYTFGISFIILAFLFFYKILLNPLVHNKEYWAGLVIVPIISLSFMVQGMKHFVNVGISLQNKTQFFIISSTVTAILNIGLNLVLIPRMGMVGAAITTLFSQILSVIILVFYSEKFFKIDFEWGKIAIATFVAIALYVTGIIIPVENIILKILIRIMLIMCFPFIVYKLNFFEEIEIQNITGSIKKWTKLANLRANLKKEINEKNTD